VARPAVGCSDRGNTRASSLNQRLNAGVVFLRYAPVIALAVAFGRLGAQDTTAAKSAPTPLGPRCNGETISLVTVTRGEPVVVERSTGVLRPFLRFALAGVPTRASAIAPFLLVKQGDKCSELLLRESERVLRAQPYLTDAKAIVTPDANGTVRVDFSTTDDIRPILGLATKGGTPTRVKLGTANLAGYGMALAAQWKQGFAFRDGWLLQFRDYSTFGRQWLFDTYLEQAPLGTVATATLSQPLYSQLQRVAWSANVVHLDNYQSFLRGEDIDPLSLEVNRTGWQVNALYRLGGGSNAVYGGVQVGGEHVSPGDRGVIITDDGFVDDPDTTLAARYTTQDRTLVSLILGARGLRFFKAKGFDALEGAQDVANGMQFGGAFGHGVGSFDGWYLGTQLYAGMGTPRFFAGLEGNVEARREGDEWNDVIGEGRLAFYSHPTQRRTRILSIEYSGAWSTTVPFELRLGTDRAGLRGYEDSETSGGRRAVVRLEDRLVFPGFKQYLGLGGAAFIDAGKMWAGDVPFGETVNPRVGAGVGLIIAIPRSSRQNLRVDFAGPLISDAGSKWTVNFTISSGRPRFWRPASDLARARSVAQTPVVFGWP